MGVRVAGECRALLYMFEEMGRGMFWQARNSFFHWKHNRPFVKCKQCGFWCSREKSEWFEGLCVDCWAREHPEVWSDDVPY